MLAVVPRIVIIDEAGVFIAVETNRGLATPTFLSSFALVGALVLDGLLVDVRAGHPKPFVLDGW